MHETTIDSLTTVKFYGVFNLGNGFQYRIGKSNQSYSFSKYDRDEETTLKAAIKGRNQLLRKELPKAMAVNYFLADNFSMSEKSHYYQVSVRALVTRKVYYLSLPKSKFNREQAEKQLRITYKKWLKIHNTIAKEYNKRVHADLIKKMELEALELSPFIEVKSFQASLWQQVALSLFPNLEHEHFISDEIHNSLESLKDNKQAKVLSSIKKKAHVLSFKNLPFFSVKDEQCSGITNYNFKNIQNEDFITNGRFSLSFDKATHPLLLNGKSFFQAVSFDIEKAIDINRLCIRFYEGISINGLQTITINGVDDLNITIETIANLLNNSIVSSKENFLDGYNLEALQECRNAAIFLMLTGILKEIGKRNETEDFTQSFLNDVVTNDKMFLSKHSSDFNLPYCNKDTQDYSDLKKSLVAISSLTRQESQITVSDSNDLSDLKDNKIVLKFKLKTRELDGLNENDSYLMSLSGNATAHSESDSIEFNESSYRDALEKFDAEKTKIGVSLNLDPESTDFLTSCMCYTDKANLPNIDLDKLIPLKSYKNIEIQAHRFSLSESVLHYHKRNQESGEVNNKTFRGFKKESCAFFIRKVTRLIDDVYDANFLTVTLNSFIDKGLVEATDKLFIVKGDSTGVYKRDTLGSKLVILNAIKLHAKENPYLFISLVDMFNGRYEENKLEIKFNELNDRIFKDRGLNYPAATRRFIIDKFPDQLSVPNCSCCGEHPNVSLRTISGFHYLTLYCENDCYPTFADNGLFRKDLVKPVSLWLKENLDSVNIEYDVPEFGISETYQKSGKAAVHEMLSDTHLLLTDIKELIEVKDRLNNVEDSKYNHYLKTPFVMSSIDYSLTLCKFYLDLTAW